MSDPQEFDDFIDRHLPEFLRQNNVSMSLAELLPVLSTHAGYERLKTRLPKWLSDKNHELRWKALWLAEHLGMREAIPGICCLLSDSDPSLRAPAASALGELGAIEAVDALIECLADAEPEVRAQAALALGWIGDRRALAPLVQLLHDGDRRVRSYTLLGLGSAHMAAPEAVPFLVSVIISDEDPGLRCNAISQAEALMILAQCLEVNCQRDRVGAPTNITYQGWKLRRLDRGRYCFIKGLLASALRLCIKTGSDDVRRAAIKTCGELKICDSIPELSRCLYDEDSDIRIIAHRAICTLKGVKSSPELRTRDEKRRDIIVTKNATVDLRSSDSLVDRMRRDAIIELMKRPTFLSCLPGLYKALATVSDQLTGNDQDQHDLAIHLLRSVLLKRPDDLLWKSLELPYFERRYVPMILHIQKKMHSRIQPRVLYKPNVSDAIGSIAAQVIDAASDQQPFGLNGARIFTDIEAQFFKCIQRATDAYYKRCWRQTHRGRSKTSTREGYIVDLPLCTADPLDLSNPLHTLLQHELVDLVLHSLNNLPDRNRDVMFSCLVYGEKKEDVAKRLNRDPRTIDRIIQSSVENIRRRLMPYLRD